MTKENQSLKITAGQSLQITVNVDAAGSTDAQTLTGATTGFWMVSNKGDSDVVLSYFSSDAEITLVSVDGTNDGIQFTIMSTDSADLSGTYFYEVWAKDTSSNVAPVATGSINVDPATGAL